MRQRSDELDSLSCRITAALQVNPRASWVSIAEALGEPERTVTRRGKELLDSGDVRVVGVIGATGAVVLRARCHVGMARAVAVGLARRDDTMFVYATSGHEECVAEVLVDDAHLADLMLDDLPGITGIRRIRVDPITRVYRSVREWRPAILDSHQIAALTPPVHEGYQPDGRVGPDISTLHRSILRVLAEDARTPTSDIARVVGATENTVRRHMDTLEQTNKSRLRVVVEPALLGYSAEALAWVKVPPRHHEALVELLLAHSEVRYAVALAGSDSLLVNLACPDRMALHRMTTASDWAALADAISVMSILRATKRSGNRLLAADSASYLY
ncbi:Lrp/AsnC family transcriptional regulator [Rhodococcus sp. IEGM 1354]|uniref:Lrp/AsnC family transcriptional regulator n=1 Tax=Rhodococcus sp. IEGM 1354 TaxID=3047088 RepID=UPI0024B854D8|nr:Lrp/AsnC family transcriptional regulator [Rhodococcus sp. IEGM 1354]MDI9930227.1 Lrp/AsnC family transcriptional regulator [Rhodococcus sp. IEGM 1354]